MKNTSDSMGPLGILPPRVTLDPESFLVISVSTWCQLSGVETLQTSIPSEFKQCW